MSVQPRQPAGITTGGQYALNPNATNAAPVNIAAEPTPTDAEQHLLRYADSQDTVQRMVAAQHPEATRQVFERLLDTREAEEYERGWLVRAIADNPSTPTDVLNRIWQEETFVTPVLTNPNADPELIRQVWEDSSLDSLFRRAILGGPNLKPYMIENLETLSVEELQAVASSPALADDLALKLLDLPVSGLDAELVLSKNQHLGQDVYHHIETYFSNKETDLRLAKNPAISEDHAMRLADSPHKEVRKAIYVGPHGHLYPQKLNRLATSPNLADRLLAAGAQHLGQDALYVLAEDISVSVRLRVIENPTSSPPHHRKALVKMKASEHERYMLAIASNPNADISYLRGIADRPDSNQTRAASLYARENLLRRWS